MDEKDYKFYILRDTEKPGIIYCNHLRSFDHNNLGKELALEIHGRTYRVIVDREVTLDESRKLWSTVTRLGAEIVKGALYPTQELEKIVDDTITPPPMKPS